MQASQVDPTFTNEDSIVIPYVSGRILAQAQANNEVNSIQQGALSIHNLLGNNKSAVLPLNHLWEIETVSVAGSDYEVQDTDPEWFVKLVGEMEPTTVKKANNLMNELAAITDDFKIDTHFQVNLMIRRDKAMVITDESVRAVSRIGVACYEVLFGNTADNADCRMLVEAQHFICNGHILHVLLNNILARTWGTLNFDCSSRVTRDWKWLGVQYLTKNTRGNFFPQLVPKITQIIRETEAALMKGSNDEWGALSALTAVIRK